MEQQHWLRDFSRYTILSVLGTLGVSCYILADTYFVSKGLGTNGLTALNLAIPVYNFIHGTGLMLGMGGATRFSICKSQEKVKEAQIVYTNTLYLALIFSVVFVLIGFFFFKQMAILLGASADISEMTNTYLRWLLLFSPAFILNDVFLCFVRNDDSPQLSMIAMLVGSLSNILLDYIFIFPGGMGIFGAVFATGLSPVISIVMMLPHWVKKKSTLRLVKTNIRKEIVKQELSLGFPSLIAQLSSGIVYLLIFSFAEPITAVFNSECNAELQQIAVSGLKWYFISIPFVGYNMNLATFFTSIEKALPAHILSILRGLILIIPMAFLLSALWEMTGVWLAYPVTEFLTALLGFVMINIKNKQKGTEKGAAH